ncbi:MAG: acetyltransferase [Chloroflexota bacterium]|jgi:sugar O-acyltransferase (sialic acid O-acetyltransferase NeuD family)
MIASDARMPAFDYDPTALLLFGGGGHGKTLIELVRAAGTHRWVGVIDDGLIPGSDVLGVPVLGGANALAEVFARGVRLAVNGVGGINHPEVRLRVFERLAQAGFNCPAVVHPTAWIDSSARLEGGAQVLAQSYVSASAVIGYGSVLNAGVVVSHDCQIGRCVNLSPGALLAGGVRVEDFAQIGMGATVNLNLTIGRGARVGNGATVKADVPPGAVVYAGTIHPPR